jgi:2-amino-4-hydroxy-6-hydroxymethyldihydropteridine diphosphokinase
METAYIGMGGNVASKAGPPEATLAAAAERLGSLGRVTRRSHLYSTEPVGYADQPRFVNAVVELETEFGPHALLEGLLRIEQEFGRDRASGIQNGPRTLDLDILLFGNVHVSEPGLEIPHPRLARRAFVLIPLNEIAPAGLDASKGATVSQLLDDLYSTGEKTDHAVVQLESGVWHAGADGDFAGPGEALRTSPCDDPR